MSTDLRPAPGSPEELTRFETLQARLSERFLRFRADVRQPYTAVVVPSQSFDPRELAKISGVAHYEERALFNLMLLRRPRLKVVMVTSKAIDPLIIDYYLHQMRGVPPAHARRRLMLLDCDDASSVPLSRKILERPRLLARIREAIDDPDRAHMAVFNATGLERSLAVQLGIPLNAVDPRLNHLGTKTGSRRLIRDAGAEVLPGREGLRDVGDLVEAVAEWRRTQPSARKVVIKLDESFSGEGNARLDLPPGGPSDPPTTRDSLRALRPEAEGLESEEFLAQFDTMGGVIEQWWEAPDLRSPSVQMRINPVGEVQVVSTHDQVLGGPSGQVFLAATFPADQAYRGVIQEQARRVGREMVSRGVIGRFGIDFLVRRDPDGEGFLCRALEINLRQGGTTHPFNMLKFLTDGTYDEESGVFRTAQGRERCYHATDNLVSPRYRGILPFDLLDHMVVEGVHFRADDTGVVFHLLGCLSQYGKLGLTSIANTVEEARAQCEQTVRRLDEMGRVDGMEAPA